MCFTRTRKRSTYTCKAPSKSAILRRQHSANAAAMVCLSETKVCICHIITSLCLAAPQRAERSSRCVQTAPYVLSGERPLLCVPFFKAQQNIQMFAGCASSHRAGINNGIGIQRHDPKWSGGQLRGYHEKTHTSYDRAGSGTWRGVGSGFLDERFACTVEPTGRRLCMVLVFFCFVFLCVTEDLCLSFGGRAGNEAHWTKRKVKCDRKTCQNCQSVALRAEGLTWEGAKLGFCDLFWIYYVGDCEKGHGWWWVGSCWETIT